MNNRFLLATLAAALVFLAPAPAPAQSLTLTAPNQSGLAWSGAEDIAWTAGTSGWAPGDVLTIELSDNGGSSYDFLLAMNIPYDLEIFRFHSSLFADGSSYRVRLSWTAGGGGSAESGYDFTIANPVTGTAYFVNDTDTALDVYCTAAGSDGNSGLSPASPRYTLQSIINGYNLGPGDVIFTDTGTWTLQTGISLTSADEGTSSGYLGLAGSPNGSLFIGTKLPASAPGFNAYISRYLDLSSFSLQSCTGQGLSINRGHYSQLHNISVTGSGKEGFKLDTANFVDITDLISSHNAGHGLYALNCNALTVSDSAFNDNGVAEENIQGLYLDNCDNSTFLSCSASGNYHGFYIASSEGLEIDNAFAENNDYIGIRLYSCTSSAVTNSFLQNNHQPQDR